jgi:hypothetical protein
MSAPPLPTWLIASDGDERVFVVHCDYPRFIVEFIGAKGTPTFLDSQEEFIATELKAGREPAIQMARLLRQAGDFCVEHRI